MGGRPSTSPDDLAAAHEQLNTTVGLDAAWQTWSACDVVSCIVDGAPIALTVDATVTTYRFVCTHCGSSSPWFEVSNGEVRSRPSTITEGPGRPSSPPDT